MSNGKYEITDIGHIEYPWLHRIRAKRQIGERVQAGDLGGYVENEDNLSSEANDDAWIFDSAIACENARVCKNSELHDQSIARGSALAIEKAILTNQAVIEDDAMVRSARITGTAHVSGCGIVVDSPNARQSPLLSENACVYGNVYGGFELGKNTVILPGEKLDNTSKDIICIRGNERTVRRGTGRIGLYDVSEPFGFVWQPINGKRIRTANTQLEALTDGSLFAYGRTQYVAEPHKLITLSRQEAEAAIRLGIRIGIASEAEDCHGSYAGYYHYSPIPNVNSLHAQRTHTGANASQCRPSIDPAYETIGLSCNQLRKTCQYELEQWGAAISDAEKGLKAYSDFVEVYLLGRNPSDVDLLNIPLKSEQVFLSIRKDIDPAVWELGKAAFQKRQREACLGDRPPITEPPKPKKKKTRTPSR